MIDLKHCNRVWMITDTHLGVRNSLEEWIEIQRDYFYNDFLPRVKREYKPGDVLFHLGDVFDSRHAITLKVLDLALDIFEALGSIFDNGVYIIAGNHDCWYKTTNEINSLKVIKRIPNIHVFDMLPETIQVGDRKFLMMPWQKDHTADVEAIQKYGKGHDYLMCHMDVYGMKGSRFNTMDTGVDTKAFSLFKQVYSGHIHYAQKMKNITMLGSPYELTRSDMYNQKGITILNVETDTETFYPNETSPRFVSITMTSVLEKSPEELKAYMKGNFVDIQVDSPNFLKIPINSIVELLDNAFRSINFIPPSFSNIQDDLDDTPDAELKDFDIKDTITKFCVESAYDLDTKKKLEDSLIKLYDRTIEQYAAK